MEWQPGTAAMLSLIEGVPPKPFSTDPSLKPWQDTTATSEHLLLLPGLATAITLARSVLRNPAARVEASRHCIYLAAVLLAALAYGEALSSTTASTGRATHVAVVHTITFDEARFPNLTVSHSRCTKLEVAPPHLKTVFGWRPSHPTKSPIKVDHWGAVSCSLVAKLLLSVSTIPGDIHARRQALGEFGELSAHPQFTSLVQDMCTFLQQLPLVQPGSSDRPLMGEGPSPDHD